MGEVRGEGKKRVEEGNRLLDCLPSSTHGGILSDSGTYLPQVHVRSVDTRGRRYKYNVRTL